MAVTVSEAQRRHATRRPLPAVLAPAAPTSDASFDRDYWLAHCEGYRVDGHEGRIGFVEEVRVERDRVILAVSAGRLGRRLLLMPSEAVDFIVPRAQRIWLRTPATILCSETVEGRLFG